MVSECTLRVRNFPSNLSEMEIEDFLRHFGAVETKVLTSKLKQRSVAYGKFENSYIAKAVLHRIHQLKILDSYICAEYAQQDIIKNIDKPKCASVDNYKNKKHYKQFITKLNAFNNAVSFNQPPPSHLKYSYPQPNRATINNIAHALASVPKFYTQVLHLMNRMSLPPPFADVQEPPSQPVIKETVQESSESELESDGEDKLKEVIPVKRKLPQKKVVKRPKFIKPTLPQSMPQQTKENMQEMFDQVDIQQRKIELKVTSEYLDSSKASVSTATVGSFGMLEPPKKPIQSTQEEQTDDASPAVMTIISDAELNANRIPVKDLSVLQVFKDYHPGVPSCRLYIKNIAKTVEKSDLEFIYKRYDVEKEGEANPFDIRLMQEGRMKGQAFVTLGNVDIAQKALKETNGYIMKNKPLVVVFARSAVPKK